MLSRVAERMYWFGRYLERAENTSRLVNVNANLLLDLPVISHVWDSLINITGNADLFYENHERAEERNVTRFLLADDSNPGSLVCTIKMLRENIRTTREIMPMEAWEQINEFYFYTRSNLQKALGRKGRHDFLDDTINFCHQITGFLSANMSHGEAYSFIRIGRNLERADMTTRIVDVGCMNLLTQKVDVPEAYDNILWMNVLRSLSGYQMYRQHVRDRVNGEDVVAFLMKDRDFPRAVYHCLYQLDSCAAELPRNKTPLRSITRVERLIRELDIPALFEGKLHEFIDQLQLELSDIHSQVAQTWFDYGTQVQEQSQSQKN
ncbi:MAG: alpha-E domain-containing protein [Gammaproteobacteria bacterium]|nr:alpha-E domain-containing protein [Gammaproteobacteria bacterium]